MGRRLLPPLLVAVAVAADAAGTHGLARAALLAAVPFAAVEAIAACGESVDRRREGGALLHAVLSSLVVALVVTSSALRSAAGAGVPATAVSATLAAIALIALDAVAALAPQLRRLAGVWPAKP